VTPSGNIVTTHGVVALSPAFQPALRLAARLQPCDRTSGEEEVMKDHMKLATVFAVVASLAFSPGLGFAAKNVEREQQQMSMDQVPAPVQAALERAAKGGTIGTVTQETDKKGKVFYEAEIDKNGKKRFVHVSPEGKILKRESAKREAREQQSEK
jgi:hypothetical protein